MNRRTSLTHQGDPQLINFPKPRRVTHQGDPQPIDFPEPRRMTHRPSRIRHLILGNSGSGKTTLARRLVGDREVPVLSLDAIAWDPGPVRRPIEDSERALVEFVISNDEWVVEGCYGDLVRAAFPHANTLWFLDPGTDRCLSHCRARPHEADKFATAEEQDAALAHLLEWVARYDERDDEYGRRSHQSAFDDFPGRRRRFTDPERYP